MEEQNNENGSDPSGEEAASNPVSLQRPESSNLSTSAQFKLNLYRPNGQVRVDISKAVLYELSRDWGDLIKIIPTNTWSTIEEIVQMVWEWEKRQFRKSFTRSRKQIEDGVLALHLAGLLTEK